MPQRQRIRYIDALRGFTMLLVIYSHLILKLQPNVYDNTELNYIFIRFRMPLFFFISGFFLYSDNYDAAIFKRRLKNRISKQLIPTLVLCALFSICFSLPFKSLPFDVNKRGYWFTYVAVEMFMIIAPILYLTDFFKAPRKAKIAILTSLAITAFVLFYMETDWLHIGKTDIGKVLSFNALLGYLPYLILGMILKATSGRLMKYIVNPVTIIAGITIFLTLVEGHYHVTSTKVSFIIKMACPIFAITALIGIFYWIYKSKLFNNGKVKVLEIVGSSTLEIYLLHYFLIQYLVCTDSEIYHTVIQWLIKTKETLWEFPVYLTASFVVAGLCIAVKLILQHTGVYDYIFNPIDKFSAHIRVKS